MVITKELEKQITPLLAEMDLLVIICAYCRRYLGRTFTEGAPGGFSHGLCKPLCDAAKADGWK